ncbi:MAG: hypothetical protein DRP79_05905 [Planctomycetota bacterium]|nr:MAG: hypothetical protein DRP79_05905 [Planctomycetota bacterium]
MPKRQPRHFKTTRTFSNYKAALKAGKKCEANQSIDMAIDFYETALSLLPESGAEQTRLEILQNLTRLQEHIGHMEEALASYNEILALPEDVLTPELQADTYRQLCYMLILQRHFDKAKDACEKGLQSAGDNVAIKAQLHALMGRIHAETSYPKKALTYCDVALRMVQKKVKGIPLAHVYNICGVSYALAGRTDTALRMFRRAKRMFTRHGYLGGFSAATGNMALCYRAMGRQLDALGLLEKSYSDARKKNEVGNLSLASFNLAVTCGEVAQYRKALRLFGEALNLAERRSDPALQRDVYFLLAKTLVKLNDPAGAESALRKTINICDKNREWEYAFVRESSRATIAWLHGKYSYALKLFDKIIKTRITARSNWELCRTLEEKLQILYARGRWKETAETAELLTATAAEHGWKVQQTTGIFYRAMAKSRMPETPNEESLTLLKNADSTLRRVVLPEAFWLNRMRLGEVHHRLGNLKEAAGCYREAMDMLQRISMHVPEEYYASYLNEPNKALLREALSGVEAELAASKKPYPAVRLLEITRSINTQLGSDRLAEAVADGAVELIGAVRGFLILTRARGLRVIPAAKTSRPARPDMTAIKHVAREVIQTNRPILTADARLDQWLSLFAPVRNIGLRSVLCVPLIVSGQVIGALYLDDPGNTGTFSGDSMSLLTSYAEQVAPAIENAHLYRENLEQRKKLADLNAQLQKRLQAREKEIEILHKIESPEGAVDRFAGLNGRSKAMQDLYHFIEKIADRSLPVLIQGESGTGKELVAKAIHFTSNRKDKPFVAENCAALPETLLESELFGYVKGAFTGADRNKKGLFEIADGGTLFLDEVGDMSPGMQAKLLRVLQEGQFRPVGGSAEIKVNVRILAASNKDLAELVKEGKFREDLLYRLNVISILVPPLRNRREDIPILVEALAVEIARREKMKPPVFDAGAMRRLLMHDWPGNVRELRNVIEKACVVASSEKVGETEIQLCLSEPQSNRQSDGSLQELQLADACDLFRKNYIARALERHRGNVSRAARACGVTRQHLYRLMSAYNLTTNTHDNNRPK